MPRNANPAFMATGKHFLSAIFALIVLVLMTAPGAGAAIPGETGNISKLSNENLVTSVTTANPTPPLSAITIYGKVTDMFGKPISNATVTVVSSFPSWEGEPSSVSTMTSGNGSYRLEQVVGHKQNISVRKDGYPEKSWDMYFDKPLNEFNMHIDIDRSTPQESTAGTLSPDETNLSGMRGRPAPVPMALILLAIGIAFVAGVLFGRISVGKAK